MTDRPLLVTDCDEVLLHMVSHMRDWLAETHAIDFAFDEEDWGAALIRRDTGQPVARDAVFPFVDAFFDSEMTRQTLVPGALAALERIGGTADIVVLTNLAYDRVESRTRQLAGHGIQHRVVCNQGGKGAALAQLVATMRPSVTVFVDDLAGQHGSVAKHMPEVWRLQMIAEPKVAMIRPKAPDAHARIDEWPVAADWILARFAEGPAPVLTDAAGRA